MRDAEGACAMVLHVLHTEVGSLVLRGRDFSRCTLYRLVNLYIEWLAQGLSEDGAPCVYRM